MSQESRGIFQGLGSWWINLGFCCFLFSGYFVNVCDAQVSQNANQTKMDLFPLFIFKRVYLILLIFTFQLNKRFESVAAQ